MNKFDKINCFLLEESKSLKNFGVVLIISYLKNEFPHGLKAEISGTCYILSKLRYYLDTITLREVFSAYQKQSIWFGWC